MDGLVRVPEGVGRRVLFDIQIENSFSITNVNAVGWCMNWVQMVGLGCYKVVLIGGQGRCRIRLVRDIIKGRLVERYATRWSRWCPITNDLTPVHSWVY